MKAIINGTLYNTDTAIPLGSANNTGPQISRTSAEWWEATLYRTPRSGRYFLAGRGGPMSMFAKSVGARTWSGGERIVPLDEPEAFSWAQEHLPTDEVEAAFPHLIEEA